MDKSLFSYVIKKIYSERLYKTRLLDLFDLAKVDRISISLSIASSPSISLGTAEIVPITSPTEFLIFEILSSIVFNIEGSGAAILVNFLINLL